MPTQAHALAATLRAILASPQRLDEAWAELLGAEYGTAAYALRHSEIVGLVASTIVDLQGLEDEDTKNRHLSYAWTWWAAVVAPELHWRTGDATPTKLITESNLHHLDSAADALAARLTGLTARADPSDLDALQSSAQEWIAFLETPAEIPPGMRQALLGQVAHLLWLIENAHLFGVARVVREGESVLGAMVSTGDRLPEDVRQRTDWSQRVQTFLVAVGTVTTLLAGTSALLDAATHDVKAGRSLVQEITSGDPRPDPTPSPDAQTSKA